MAIGGVFPTPEAQCKGVFSCEYALVPYGSECATAAAEAYAFNSPVQVAQTALHGGAIAPKAAFVALQPAPLVLSACKKADGRSGMIVRFFNPTDECLQARLTLGIEFDQVFVCDLAENRLRELAITGDGYDTVEIDTGGERDRYVGVYNRQRRRVGFITYMLSVQSRFLIRPVSRSKGEISLSCAMISSQM